MKIRRLFSLIFVILLLTITACGSGETYGDNSVQDNNPSNIDSSSVISSTEETVHSSTANTTEPTSTKLRTMTFNVRVGEFEVERIDLVFKMIDQYAPDTFGIQEASDQWMDALKAYLPQPCNN